MFSLSLSLSPLSCYFFNATNTTTVTTRLTGRYNKVSVGTNTDAAADTTASATAATVEN